LSHYAFRVWNHSHHNSWNLYGHSHGLLPGNSQQLDVGVDCWNYTPCSYEQVKERLKTLPDEINAYYAKRRKFIRGLPSYQQIEGTSPEAKKDSNFYTDK
jgi:hypothetical protein